MAERKKGKKERTPKITTKVVKGRAKAVRAFVDGEQVVNVVEIKTTKPQTTAYLSSTKAGRASVKAHATEDGALNRFRGVRRRFPQITPRVKKLL